MAVADYYRRFNGPAFLGGSFASVRAGDWVRADLVKSLSPGEKSMFGGATKFGSIGVDESYRDLEIITTSSSKSSIRSAPMSEEAVSITVSGPQQYVECCPLPISESEDPDVVINPSLERAPTPSWVKQVFESRPWRGWSNEESEVVWPQVEPISVSAPSVAIAVPVYNNPSRFVPFFESVFACTSYPNLSAIVVVADGCDEYSIEILKQISERDDRVLLIEQENVGYLKAANRAINRAFYIGADYVVTCNTDLMCTHGWLSGMVRAAIRRNAALVNPLSNQQALISLPMSMEAAGGMRRLGGRVSYVDAAIVASYIPPSYPDAVTNIGNCMLIERSAWEDFGPFDGMVYGDGYGEECELWARCREDGRRCVVADDVYVYHESHATIEHASQKERDGLNTFLERWKPLYNREVIKMRTWDKKMDKIRSISSSMLPHSMPVRFIALNIGNYGGVQCVVTIVNGLIKRGFNASIEYTVKQPHDFFFYVGPNRHSNPESIKSLSEDEHSHNGIMVATHWYTGEIVYDISKKTDKIIPVAFWQDREDYFINKNGSRSVPDSSIKDYTRIPNRVVNARWVGDTAVDDLSITSFRHIPVGVDCHKFYPGKKRESKVVVVSMYRPSTPRRGAGRLDKIYRQLKQMYRDRVSLETFGEPCSFSDVDHGQCSQDKVAKIMRHANIVFEPSDFQGFGLPGLEGMASGCAVVSTDNLGVYEYGRHSENCFIAKREADVFEHLCELIDNPELVIRLGEEGRKTALQFDWEIIIDRWAEYLNELYIKSGMTVHHPDPLPF